LADNEEQEKNFKVKDKRRVKADKPAQEPEPEPVETVETPDEAAPSAEEIPEEREQAETAEEAAMPVPNVTDWLRYTAMVLSELAWQQMGLRLAPGQKEATVDMAQAKLAIDTIVFITDKLHPTMNEQERKEIRALVSDLQLNFVRHGANG